MPMTLDGKILASPDDISWDFKMKTVEIDTLGGKVIQVYGVDTSDLVVTGKFSQRQGSAPWQERDRMQAQVESWMTSQVVQRSPRPLSFSYPERKWSFKVFVKGFGPASGGAFSHTNDQFSLDWKLTLFVVDDLTGRVVRGIKDEYLDRLMNGVGWKMSSYNGPTADQIESALAPFDGSLRAYMEQGLTKMVGGTGEEDSAGSLSDQGLAALGGGGGAFADIVALGKHLQSAYGCNVAEHPAFGGVAPVHATNSDHYIGKAIDVNADGVPGGEKAMLDKVNKFCKDSGFFTIWQAAGHYDHLHVADKR